MAFNPLVVILSARDISLVREQIEKTLYGKYNVLWVKYYPAPQSYNIGIKYFLDSDHYTHLVMVPDDVVLNQKSWDLLIKTAPNHDVISGVCNQTCANQTKINQTNICFDEMPDPSMISLDYIEKLWVTFDKLGNSEEPLKVIFAGFPVTFIKREIVKKMGTFTGDKLGQNIDVAFSKFLLENGIDQFIIPAANFLHLKHHPDPKLSSTNFFVGKKSPKVDMISSITEQVIK